MSEGLYSDIWYSVASMCVGLPRSVRVGKQVYRGRLWYVLEEPHNHAYFRLTPQAWDFVKRLDPGRTVEEIWEQYAREYPDRTPGQDEVIRLLSQLHTNNLLTQTHSPRSEDMFERHRKGRGREQRSKLVSFLFLRIPLFNPERWLNASLPWVRPFFSWWGWALWWTVVIWALKLVFENHDVLWKQTQGVLGADNLILLYLTLVLLKTVHELGHAFIAKHHGGVVPRMGVMLLLLTPVPYLDVTSSWFFRYRRQRMVVGLGGMVAELFVAALATVVWVNTGEGAVNAVAFNAMLIGSVSSLIFNGNPLVKFDAYYILSDAIGVPNLYQRSRDWWLDRLERWVLGRRDGTLPGGDRREWAWMAVYGALSLGYRLLISVSILMFVADQWLLLGGVILIIFLSMWVVKPAWQLVRHLYKQPDLRRRRTMVGLGTVGLTLAAFLWWIPFPRFVILDGVLEAEGLRRIHAPVEGRVLEMHVEHGQWVERGDLLLNISTHEIELDLRQQRGRLAEAESQLLRSTDRRSADREALRGKTAWLRDRITRLEERLVEAKVLATEGGIWVSDRRQGWGDAWVQERQQLGQILPRDSYRFFAVATQEDAFALFGEHELKGHLMLEGREGEVLPVDEVQILPHELRQLPSPVLGWLGGGQLAVRQDDPEGRTTAESFFRVRFPVNQDELSGTGYHHRQGRLRVDLPRMPLADQMHREFRQLLQKRYRF